MNHMRGFTLIEVMVAIVVLAVGLLGLASTSAQVTRMIARGQRSAAAATFGAQRLERLRATACSTRPAGSERLNHGPTWMATNAWSFTDAGNETYHVLVVTTYRTDNNRTRTDALETAVSCLP